MKSMNWLLLLPKPDTSPVCGARVEAATAQHCSCRALALFPNAD